MSNYAIIRHIGSGHLFRIGRRSTELPGRIVVHDWVKIRCDDRGSPKWTEPQYLTVQFRTRAQVEQHYLDIVGDYELFARVEL